MGTNFYVRTPPCASACDHCDASQILHLGKASGGWRFLFHADPEWPRDEAFRRWLQRAANGHIEDECGNRYSVAELLRRIYARDDQRSHTEPQTDLGYVGPDDSRFRAEGHDFSDRAFS